MATKSKNESQAEARMTRRRIPKWKVKTEAAPETAPVGDGGEQPPEPATEPEPKPRRTRRKKGGTKAVTVTAEPQSVSASDATELPPVLDADDGEVLTLGDLSAAYARHLEEVGKSESTVRSYRADMALACSVLGADLKLVDITSESVAAFNEDPRVVATKDGQPKARNGVEKHRRVLRQALAFAAKEGFIEKAPVPEAYAAG